MQYWMRRLKETFSPFSGSVSLVPCADLAALESVNPEIVVGQESSDLIRYLSSRPPALRWVQFLSAGLDKTLQALGEGGVAFKITNMRGIHSSAMAEYFLAVALYFEKNLDHFVAAQGAREWSRLPLAQMRRKRLLVCGAGAIGQGVAAAFCAMGGRADAVARTPEAREPFGETFSLSALENIAGEYDYIFCALPLTEETRQAFNARVFRAMRKGAIFVNIARGDLVDEQALIEVLKTGHLRGAALDVFTIEPLPAGSPLWSTPRLLITPHVSGLFAEGHDLGLDLVFRNMSAFIEKRPLESEVFPDRGY